MIAPPPVVITEIMYDLPGSDAGREWVELTNLGADAVALPWAPDGTSWRFSDGTSHLITQFQSGDHLNPGESLILAAEPVQFLADHPDYAGPVAGSAFTLPNTAGVLSLSVDGGASWLASRSYTANLGGAGDGHSLEWDGDQAVPSRAIGGTPGRLRPPPPVWPAIPFATRFELSEVQYDPPGTDAGREWLEVRNVGSLAVDLGELSGQLLVAIDDHIHPITPVAGSASLAPGDRWLMTDTGPAGPAVAPGVAVGQAALTLPNRPARLRLSFDGGRSWVMDETYDPAFGGAGDGRTLERDPQGGWGGSTLSGGTPGAPPSPVAELPAPIRINEFLPVPAPGEPEWIELANRGPAAVDLAGWRLDDGPGGSPPYLIPNERAGGTLIAPGGYLVFFRPETGLVLGNQRDQVRLIDPHGRVRSTIPYSPAAAAMSWMADDAGLGRWTLHPTPGAPNIWESLSTLVGVVSGSGGPAPVLALSDQRAIIIDQRRPLTVSLVDLPTTAGWHLRVSGMVVASDAQSAILADGTGTVRLRFHLAPGTKPPIHAGDFLTAVGRWEFANGQPVLSVANAADVAVVAARRTARRPLAKHPPPRQGARAGPSRRSSSRAHRVAEPLGLTLAAPPLAEPLPISTAGMIAAMLVGLLGALAWFMHARPLPSGLNRSDAS